MADVIETKYGFRWGSLNVERIAAELRNRGEVVLGLDTPKHCLQVYATKTGKVRIWLDGDELRP